MQFLIQIRANFIKIANEVDIIPSSTEEDSLKSAIITSSLSMNKVSTFVNLRRLILLFTLFFVILTFINVLYASYHEQKQLLIQNTLESNRVYASKLADTVDHIIGAMQNQLAYQSRDIIKYFNNPKELDRIADNLLQDVNGFNAVQIVNAEGLVLGSSPESLHLLGTYLRSKGSIEIRKKRVPMITAPYISALNHQVISMSYPLFDSKKTYLGYVSGVIRLQNNNILHEILEDHSYRDGSHIYVVDSQHHLLYNHDPSRLGTVINGNPVVDNVLNNQRGEMQVRNSLDQEMLAGYAPITRLGWGVVAQRPLDRTFTKLRNLIISTTIKTVPLLLLSFIIIWYLSRQIALPLWKLAVQARSLDSPDTKNAYQDIKTWYFEAAQLKESMLVGLQLVDTKMDQLDRESLTDPLTGLTNRRGMERVLAQWGSTPYCVLSIDIDHFKQVNDTYGHQIGDVVLQGVAAQMRLNFRPHDLLCRVGGEEFLIFMPTATLEDGYAAAERLRQAIEAYDFAEVGHITISVGLAHQDAAPTLTELFKLVDAALYEAKHTGRNKTVIHQTLSVDTIQPAISK